MSEIPEGLTELAEKKGFETVEAFAESYTSLESDRSRLVNELNDVKGKIPVKPESLDAYKVDIEGIDKGRVDAFKQIAFEKGLQPEVFNDVVKWAYESETKAYEAMQAETQKLADEANKKFRESLGDDPDKSIQDALDMANKLGVSEYLKEQGAADDPVALTILSKVMSMTQEDKIPTTPSATNTQGSEEKLAELAKELAGMSRTDPDRAAKHRQYLSLSAEVANKKRGG